MIKSELINQDKKSLDNPENILEIIEAEFQRANISLGLMYNTLKEGLLAKKISYNKFGEIVEEIDYNTRHKYLITALELLKHLRDKNIPVVDNSQHNHFSGIKLIIPDSRRERIGLDAIEI